MALLSAPLSVRRCRSRRGQADGFQVSDIPSVDAAKAISHPMRFQILATLHGEPRSPQSLAAEIHVPLTNLSYHVKVLERLGAIELTGTRSVGGTTEHFYRARWRVRVDAQLVE